MSSSRQVPARAAPGDGEEWAPLAAIGCAGRRGGGPCAGGAEPAARAVPAAPAAVRAGQRRAPEPAPGTRAHRRGRVAAPPGARPGWSHHQSHRSVRGCRPGQRCETEEWGAQTHGMLLGASGLACEHGSATPPLGWPGVPRPPEPRSGVPRLLAVEPPTHPCVLFAGGCFLSVPEQPWQPGLQGLGETPAGPRGIRRAVSLDPGRPASFSDTGSREGLPCCPQLQRLISPRRSSPFYTLQTVLLGAFCLVLAMVYNHSPVCVVLV